MNEEKPRPCSTKSALAEMLETASRRLTRAQSSEAVEKAKAAVESLTQRIAVHRQAHQC